MEQTRKLRKEASGTITKGDHSGSSDSLHNLDRLERTLLNNQSYETFETAAPEAYFSQEFLPTGQTWQVQPAPFSNQKMLIQEGKLTSGGAWSLNKNIA